jgi:hypothetical protein
MAELHPFLARVAKQLPPPSPVPAGYVFKHWSVPGKVTDEGVGILPLPGVDADKFLRRVLDFDHYKGPIPHVAESRAVPDATLPAGHVRFYQKLNIPVIGDIHQESVMAAEIDLQGWRTVAWHLDDKATETLSPKVAIRGQYSDGAWLVAPGVVGYALSSAPRREDVGFLKWKALTTGADVAAGKVIRDNIAAMARWAATL